MSPDVMLEIGRGLFAHASGGLWIPGEQTLLVADVHLGYAWAQRRRGQLGPLTEGGVREKLAAVLTSLDPRRLVVIGDLVHAPKPGTQEREVVEATLQALAEGREILLVRGNHDRAFGRDFGHLPVRMIPFWSGDTVTAVHGDRPQEYPLPHGHTLVLGHWHPTVSIADSAGATLRLPVFLQWPAALILPAFSPFAAGFDVSRGYPPQLMDGIPASGKPVQVYAATGTRIRRLGRMQPRRRKARQSAGAASDSGPTSG
jgi:putative SbcD/Mre11-related phosphoesterase